MRYVDIDDVRLHVRTDGDPARPCIVLSNSLGTDLAMWDPQAAVLARDYFVLRYDTRGHGLSRRGTMPVTLERLGRDVVGLLDALAIPRAHFCGISMGGMTGQWLGIHAPRRLDRLVLANTAARIGTHEGWTARAAQVRAGGMDGVADGAAARWFTPAFLAREPHVVARMIARLREQDAEGYAACCDALADADLRSAIGTIAVPTLIIAGAADPVTTVADAGWMRDRIPGACLVALAASHISSIEAAPQFAGALVSFLAG
ncbi:3-oxoadipate enol-lactonase [Massilia sp. Root133]|uniref:3-oxoadipate enol-lactonase n=1 Tax=Massilia cellulosiltytica TaxID=2683234 RepID=A0A7X3K9G1_9BURK|nr:MULTISPECIES: 3-oxoadipate enol-lactonase [Telluria group]KQX95699.1 3-oxoadipate enol-lactonase [Massilia sp. Root133]KQZ35046.1 3-oxoadipate enol-lactonase [Massilia sp. Root1485]MVW62989.1 3-oxoadipate enol-lactonase [Telluria cellulosilytica]